MGATLWYHDTPWQPDAKTALRQLQAQIFQADYDFKRDLEKWCANTAAALRLEKESGDRFGLVDMYENGLERVRKVLAAPVPKDALEQLAILREFLDAGEGIGSILDVTDVNATGGPHVMRMLTANDMLRYTASTTPTRDEVEDAIPKLNDILDRGDSFALIIHDKTGTPTHWFFIGNTVD